MKIAPFVRRAHRLAGVLVANGYTTRGQILAAFDGKGRGALGISGIGKVLRSELVQLLDAENYGPLEWQQLMIGIAWTDDEAA